MSKTFEFHSLCPKTWQHELNHCIDTNLWWKFKQILYKSATPHLTFLASFKPANSVLQRSGNGLKAFKPQTIQVQLRPNNLLGRLGGEEFTIFMADTSLKAAYACAEQIRQHKSQTAISIDQQRHFSSSSALACVFACLRTIKRWSIYSIKRMMHFIRQKDRAEIGWSFRHNMLQFSKIL